MTEVKARILPVSLAIRPGLFDSRGHDHELQFISPEKAWLSGKFAKVAGRICHVPFLIEPATVAAAPPGVCAARRQAGCRGGKAPCRD